MAKSDADHLEALKAQRDLLVAELSKLTKGFRIRNREQQIDSASSRLKDVEEMIETYEGRIKSNQRWTSRGASYSPARARSTT